MAKLYHEVMNEEEKKVVDGVYNAVAQYCNENGITISGDDRAEEFVEAIAKYLEVSMKY